MGQALENATWQYVWAERFFPVRNENKKTLTEDTKTSPSGSRARSSEPVTAIKEKKSVREMVKTTVLGQELPFYEKTGDLFMYPSPT